MFINTNSVVHAYIENGNVPQFMYGITHASDNDTYELLSRNASLSRLRIKWL